MLEFLIHIMKGIGLAFVITSFEPIHWVVDLLPNNFFKYITVLLTSCWRCCSFWITFFMYGLWPAVTAYTLLYFILEIKEIINRKYINKI